MPALEGGSAAFFEALKNRRTIYTLGKESTIPDEKVVEIVKNAVLHTPSSFNSQTTRAVVLFGAHHDKLWSIVLSTLKAIVPAENFPATEGRIAGFAAAYGTVLWFEDQAAVKKLQEGFALYADRFPLWSEQTGGMHQLVTWTALEAEGLGGNLQHYNPLIDADVRKEWGVPEDWKLNAQLVFGKPTAGPGDKVFGDIEERVKVFN
ncbi:Nitroreductase-like protein [Geopyxis carbonaria]|nr:Nitroreductase-like protein [Geopyxis carbonaria]